MHLIGNIDGEIHATERLKLQSREKKTIPVQINWIEPEGDIPDQKIFLKSGDKVLEESIVLSGTTISEFTDLFLFDLEGNEIPYRIQAKSPENYSTDINGYQVNNTYQQPAVEEEKVPQEKPIEEISETVEEEETLVEDDIVGENIEKQSDPPIENPQPNNTEELKNESIEEEATSTEVIQEMEALLPKKELPPIEEVDLKQYLLTENIETEEKVRNPVEKLLLESSPLSQGLIQEEVLPNTLIDLVEKGSTSIVSIKVKDYFDNPVEAAFFEIKNNEDPSLVYAIGPSDKEGNIELELPYGNYSIKQTATSGDFNIATNINDLDIQEKETAVTIVNNSKSLSQVYIQTVDPAGEPLDGGSYRLTSLIDPTNSIDISESTPRGLMAEVPLGEYRISQLEAPLG